MKICTIEGCEIKQRARGFCGKHYHRWLIHGDPLVCKKFHGKRDPICTIKGCNGKHSGLGYCQKHYRRLKIYGNPLIIECEMHGKTKTPEYNAWIEMKMRCHNLKHKEYKNYGGRGITVCERWKNSFMAFYENMGEKPFPKAQIDRINNDGNYEPGNSRWTTAKINSRNSRATKLTMEIAERVREEYIPYIITQSMLGKKYGVRQVTISNILRRITWT